jgi:hypothetical protein
MGFLTGALEAFADFMTGSTSCTEGSSTALVSEEGAVVASLFGSSLSLQRKGKKIRTSRKEESEEQNKDLS